MERAGLGSISTGPQRAAMTDNPAMEDDPTNQRPTADANNDAPTWGALGSFPKE